MHVLESIAVVKSPPFFDVLPENGLKDLWERHAAVLLPLPVSHGDFAAIERYVLNAQTQHFAHTHPRPVHQPCQQHLDSVHLLKQGRHLAAAQNNGQTLGNTGAGKIAEVTRFSLDDVLVKKHDRIQGLVLRACRHVTVNGEVTQELVDFALPHGGRSAPVVVRHELAHPGNVALLCLQSVVPQTQFLLHGLPQERPFRSAVAVSPDRRGHRCRLLGCLPGRWRRSRRGGRTHCRGRLPPGPAASRTRSRPTPGRGSLCRLRRGTRLPASGQCVRLRRLMLRGDGAGGRRIQCNPPKLLVVDLQRITRLPNLPVSNTAFAFQKIQKRRDLRTPQVAAPPPTQMAAEELPNPLSIRTAMLRLDSQFLKHLEIPPRPHR